MPLPGTLSASYDAGFCLKCTVCCAMLSPSDSCVILHKSSVSPGWRRTLPADLHPIDEKAVSMSRIRLSPFPRDCGVMRLAAAALPRKMSEFIPSESISWIGCVLRVSCCVPIQDTQHETSLTANPALKLFNSKKETTV
jgi:hypothetical protein